MKNFILYSIFFFLNFIQKIERKIQRKYKTKKYIYWKSCLAHMEYSHSKNLAENIVWTCLDYAGRKKLKKKIER